MRRADQSSLPDQAGQNHAFENRRVTQLGSSGFEPIQDFRNVARGSLPVLQGQARHTAELGSVVGHEDQSIRQRRCRDHQVIRADE